MVKVRTKFGSIFGYEKIPLINEKGNLYYTAGEIEEPEKVLRIGGGYIMES